MKCKCGHVAEVHADKVAYRGQCLCCSCLIFDIAIVQLPMLNHQLSDELDKDEIPLWQYERNKAIKKNI